MRIKSFCLNNFKRFTDLKVYGLLPSTKLVVLIGPNGCGKSSVFDAFYYWQNYRAYSSYYDADYAIKKKDDKSFLNFNPDLYINIYFEDQILDHSLYEKVFYFRTAYRNDSEFTLQGVKKSVSPYYMNKDKRMLKNDVTVSENYNRIITKTFEHIYDGSRDECKVSELRDELIGKINESLLNVFGSTLRVSNLGDPSSNGCFFFEKGGSKSFDYKNLSSGEKSAFDLILDLICKKEYFDNSIYCIDEPENHIHTQLQGKLIRELYRLTGEKSQLWIATHSLGMMKEARLIEENNPGTVAFINFGDYDYDKPVSLQPSKPSKELLNKILEIALDDFYDYICPEKIVFCEGSSKGKRRKDFDARCYNNIFSNEFSNFVFYSNNSCNDVSSDDNLFNFVSSILHSCDVVKLIDRDDRSNDEIKDLKSKNVIVLTRRNLESYLLDDEVIAKFCESIGKPSEVYRAIAIKQQALNDSISRGNAADDLKKAAGDFYTNIKKEFGLTSIGNNSDTFMRDTLSKLITPDMNVYQELKKCIFNRE